MSILPIFKYMLYTLLFALHTEGILNETPFLNIIDNNLSWRARSTSDLSQKDCLEILTEAQQILREEYLQKQNRAKVEIEKR